MKKLEAEKYTGLLDGHFETGSEGTYWVLDTGDTSIGFLGLVSIEKGDYLKVYAFDGTVAFEGTIIPDYRTGWKHFLGHPDPKAGQQAVFGGWWVHWIQKGWKPDEWGKLFIWHWFKEGRGAQQCRAELTKAKKNRPK